ncbi:MAG: hypothetical protein PHP50_12330 [Lachnospiraceae bacterium]|nr:hypothetical protein [Lachnospiraceae bacterium]
MILKEEQRYGRLKSTAVNHTYINSGFYRKKFDTITDSMKLNRLLYEKAKEMLNHRSGTEIEDMYWFDAENEKVLYSKLDEEENEIIRHSDLIDRTIRQCECVIAMHTHPHSLPPSAEDFNCFVNFNYSLGIVICHDGSIFVYTAEHEINKELWNAYVQDALEENGREQKAAQMAALHNFVVNGDIEVWEV